MTIIDPSVSISSSGSGGSDFLYLKADSVLVPVTSRAGDGTLFNDYSQTSLDAVLDFKSRPVFYQIEDIQDTGKNIGASYVKSYDIEAQELSGYLSEIVHTNYIGEFSISVTIRVSGNVQGFSKEVDVITDGTAITAYDGIDGEFGASSSSTYAKMYVVDFDIPW